MSCTLPPAQLGAVSVGQNAYNCGYVEISWALGESCSPIQDTEVQCIGADGIQTNVPSGADGITGSTFSVDAAQFMKEPFMLSLGNAVVCRARTANSNGWGNWSEDSASYPLATDCEAGQGSEVATSPTNRCRQSCKATGCGGACNHQNGTFWSDVAKKACCKIGTCGGCKPKTEADKQHRHKYCHVHAEDKNKTRKRLVWQDRKVTRQQEVLKPFQKIVKRMTLEQQTVERPQVRMVKKTRRVKKTVYKKQERTIKKIKWVKKMANSDKIMIYTRQRVIQLRKFKKEKRSMKVVEFRNKTVQIKALKYVVKSVPRRAVRMVTEIKTVKKEVPKTIPVPVGNITNALRAKMESCGCFKNECECYGNEGCECSYPACGCAPTAFSPTEMEFIISNEECEVPQDYVEMITQEVPVLTEHNYTYQEPFEITKMVEVDVPYLVNSTEEYDEPGLVPTKVEVEVPVETEETQLFDVPVEIEVEIEREEPEYVMQNVTMSVPVWKEIPLTEMRTEMEDVEVTVPVAHEIYEKIPSPPCHWHDITHSHDVVGCASCTKTHTHYHPDN